MQPSKQPFLRPTQDTPTEEQWLKLHRYAQILKDLLNDANSKYRDFLKYKEKTKRIPQDPPKQPSSSKPRYQQLFQLLIEKEKQPNTKELFAKKLQEIQQKMNQSKEKGEKQSEDEKQPLHVEIAYGILLSK